MAHGPPQHGNRLHQDQQRRTWTSKREARLFCNLFTAATCPRLCRVLAGGRRSQVPAGPEGRGFRWKRAVNWRVVFTRTELLLSFASCRNEKTNLREILESHVGCGNSKAKLRPWLRALRDTGGGLASLPHASARTFLGSGCTARRQQPQNGWVCLFPSDTCVGRIV